MIPQGVLVVGGAIAAVLIGRRLFGRGGALMSGTAGRDDVSRVTVSNSTITGSTGVAYRVTADDRLWLGRAVFGEAGTNPQGGAAVAWSMANNFAGRWTQNGRRQRTLTSLLRAYCQPINPAWSDPNGEKCRAHPEQCTARILGNRQRIQSTSWEGLPASVRTLVDQFLAGQLANPAPGSTDWAARDWNAIGMVNINGNRFGRRA